MKYETGHFDWRTLTETTTFMVIASAWFSTSSFMINAASPEFHFTSRLAIPPLLAAGIASLSVASWAMWTRHADAWVTLLARMAAWTAFFIGLYDFSNGDNPAAGVCLFLYASAMMLMVHPNSLGRLHGKLPLPQMISVMTLACPFATLLAQAYASDGNFLMPTAEAFLLGVAGINLLCLQAGECRMFLRAKQGILNS